MIFVVRSKQTRRAPAHAEGVHHPSMAVMKTIYQRPPLLEKRGAAMFSQPAGVRGRGHSPHTPYSCTEMGCLLGSTQEPRAPLPRPKSQHACVYAPGRSKPPRRSCEFERLQNSPRRSLAKSPPGKFFKEEAREKATAQDSVQEVLYIERHQVCQKRSQVRPSVHRSQSRQ